MADFGVYHAALVHSIGAGAHGEDIDYLPAAGGTLSIRVPRPHEVREFESDELLAGARYARQHNRPPIFILVSKDDVATVTERQDKVVWKGVEYTVLRIASDQPGAWRLYCG